MQELERYGMDTTLADFEKRMKREINAYLSPDTPGSRTSTPTKGAGPRERPSAKAMKTGHIVTLAVRTKQLEMDTVFEHHSSSISKLEARMEAEKAARKAGYPIVGHVIDIQRL